MEKLFLILLIIGFAVAGWFGMGALVMLAWNLGVAPIGGWSTVSYWLSFWFVFAVGVFGTLFRSIFGRA